MNQIWQRGQTDAETIPDGVLYSRIADTIAWCNKILAGKQLAAALRSDEIKPRLLHDGGDDAVCNVGHTRHWMIKLTTEKPRLAFPDLVGGKLLAYFPDDDLCDGAAEIESDCFFDIFNCPPWDTWVAFFDEHRDDGASARYLLSYVPEQLVDLAQAGINVNPEQCILWLNETDVKLKSRLLNHLVG